MKKILLAYNPVSGSAVFRKKLDEIIESLQRRKILPVIYRTRAENSAEEFFECVKISDVQGILAAGGDGTLHRVINWIKKFEINLPVGIIGSGTSNDFATHLKIFDTEKYFDAIAENKIRPIDLGLVNEKEFFINVASAGVFTSIAHEVDSRQKNALGKIAYYLRGIGELPKFKTVELEIKADEKIFRLEAFLFLVLNSPAVAGMKKISDVAKIGDGKLDFLALKKCSPRKLFTVTQKLLAGKCIDSDPNIFYLQAKTFEIKSSANLISDLDGEVGGKLPIKIETLPQAVNFFVL
ncbi:MAG: diacylglycerol kinase family lipid kinase [Selenomonadaceae bacterium]|nr:diacylglycerol kinase family lipid kinase [Selenomonadaceae bacterium]